MNVNGIGTTGYPAWYETRKSQQNTTGKGFANQVDKVEKVLSDEELEQTANQESETKTDIIVKPDGSRVLVMTMSVGGMETNMSLEISKPTKILNENLKQDTDRGDANKIIDNNGGIEK